MIVKTPRGTELPLTNLKGRQYLMVAYRIQWFNEEVPQFNIDTQFLHLDDNQTVARATVEIVEDGKVVRKVSATKRETKSDFSDHTEKAETAAIGRALSLLGYGTQFALSDLDEGSRLADSPLEQVGSSSTKSTSFRRNPKKETTTTEQPKLAVVTSENGGWEN